ncbi:Uncharacterised protein [Serratia rubidaea]|uniref:Uncharacterized protein n=1 Tax=Serratia rubidaea TaxID=61652 RepID=A0A447QVP9_SERRU|nr:Uncharacterised protein [Serratia rubidaea]
MVFKGDRLRHVTGFAHDGPGLHQVLVLAGVDVVQHAVGAQGFVAVFGAGDIGGGVQVAAVLFLDDDAHRIAVFVFVFVQEYHGGAFAFHRQPLGLKVSHDARQHGVVQAFTHYVVFGQRDVEALIGFLVLRHGDIHQLAPHFQAVVIAALQLDHVSARTLSELGVFVVVALGFTIKLLRSDSSISSACSFCTFSR